MLVGWKNITIHTKWFIFIRIFRSAKGRWESINDEIENVPHSHLKSFWCLLQLNQILYDLVLLQVDVIRNVHYVMYQRVRYLYHIELMLEKSLKCFFRYFFNFLLFFYSQNDLKPISILKTNGFLSHFQL